MIFGNGFCAWIILDITKLWKRCVKASFIWPSSVLTATMNIHILTSTISQNVGIMALRRSTQLLLCPAWSVLRLVTICEYTVFTDSQLPRPTWPCTLNWTEKDYWPKCGKALHLGRNTGYGSYQMWIIHLSGSWNHVNPQAPLNLWTLWRYKN